MKKYEKFPENELGLIHFHLILLIQAEELKLAQQERLDKLAEAECAFQLQKLWIECAAQVNVSTNTTTSHSEATLRKTVLKDLVPKFVPKVLHIALFFMIFENQAKKEKIEESGWVSQLILLLPQIQQN